MDNSVLIGYVKDITIAKLQSSNISANEKSGKDVADFMQCIYDKLSELNRSETK